LGSLRKENIDAINIEKRMVGFKCWKLKKKRVENRKNLFLLMKTKEEKSSS